ncbi:MAG TPA: hypothetical protein VI911_06715 [Patescibacteria group bacterium]|nr:hypothetical protein [Patescibacteria group bacterium]
MTFCSCEDGRSIAEKNPLVFQWVEPYGWVLSWKELVNEISHTRVYTYGININYCPICGKKLEAKIN